MTDSPEPMIDAGVPTTPTDAGGYTPEMGDAIRDATVEAVDAVLEIPAVQRKVSKGWATFQGYGYAAASAIPAILGLADVLHMPNWLVATFSGISAVLVALTNKNRTDQAIDLNRTA